MAISVTARTTTSRKKLLALALAALLALGALGAVALSPSETHAAAKPKPSSTSKKVVKGKTWYCYNDDSHNNLNSWDGANYSGGSSLYRVSTSEVPSKLKQYMKRR